MRKVLMVLLCSLSMVVRATDYYVSSSGNDSANGLTSSTPWQSISKVNSVFSSLNPGDRILFKRGERFYGALQISRSGSSGSPITLSAYGTGANPVISGFTTITGWNNYGSGIYSKAVSCQSRPNMVTVNDINTPIGRWPNTGFLFIDSHVSNTSISDANLPSSPDWTGAEVVIRKNEYIWDRNKIIAHSGTTLQYTSGSYYNAIDGFGYFIQNSLKTLDQQGEWYYDGSTFYMYFGSANPASYVVKVSSVDQLASLLDKNYITFENLAFEGANLYSVQISNSDYVTVKNCQINFTGGIAIFGPWNGTSPNCTISNNNISNSNNNAIRLMGNHTSATVTNNTITKTGLIVGMGQSGDGTYNAIDVYGDGGLVQYNTVENSGYLGIHFSGNNTTITNNLVNGFNLVKNDGGGIYTYVGTGTPCSGQKVINNVVLNGAGYGEGETNKQYIAFGIYMDDRVRNVVVTGNTVANCSAAGIYIHNAHEIEISKNTLYNNGSGQSNYGAQIVFVHDGYSPDDPIRNINMNNNIFLARTTAQRTLSFSTVSNDISSLGSADYNCYAKPVDNTYVARTWSAGWNSAATNRSLSNWQSFSGKDKNSFTSPIAITDVNKIRFEYNGTNSNKTVSLDASYIDVKRVKYSGTITLAPYSSVVLLPDPNPSAPPSIPAYVSSAIENAAPAIVAMNYNLSLANIVPAASAFAVQVNSVARSVTAVSVTGTRVSLTLSSPVAYGNTVTVAYTKPSSNPLQTPAGGQAVSLSAQSVTNRITAPAPPAPAYISSSVENAAPAVIVLNYSLALANTVPLISAFSVQVNSIARSITAVSVSGTRVSLTISSPAAYGNTVTVAYTKPASNPLQTPAGGQAVSFSAQTVTNRINAPAPPAAPAYVSSSVENAAPAVVVLNYSLALANIVPAASSFAVQVNSTARSVSSVAVSGTKVSLTLASPVAYGNTLTVAYTKPPANQLQSTAGQQAASMSAQTVSNRVSAPTPLPAAANAAPVPVVNTMPTSYSGFQGILNASGSYDPNNDKLTYTWIVPKNVPVSASTGPIIKFLGPVVDASQKIEFTLNVSDGKTTESKIIPVEILPYQPELIAAEVVKVEASGFQTPNFPYNIVDGNIGTMWAANGNDQWVILELKEAFSIQHVKVAFQPGQNRETIFDVYGSEDKETWEPILSKSKSCAFSSNLQVFDFPPSKTGKEFKFVKVVGQGNAVDTWNYISEFKIFGYGHRNPTSYEEQPVKIYPNPATDFINILIEDAAMMPDNIRIVSLSGKIMFEDVINPDVREFRIPIDLFRGIYIIQMGEGNLTLFTQKLIVGR